MNNDAKEQLLINWLQNDWLKLIDDVVGLCTEYFEKDEEVGAISKEEARELLLQVDGNKIEVVKLYSEQRKKKVSLISLFLYMINSA